MIVTHQFFTSVSNGSSNKSWQVPRGGVIVAIQFSLASTYGPSTGQGSQYAQALMAVGGASGLADRSGADADGVGLLAVQHRFEPSAAAEFFAKENKSGMFTYRIPIGDLSVIRATVTANPVVEAHFYAIVYLAV